MWRAPESVGTFLRAYFHYKSADWTGNKPHPLASFSADELAKMPTYYVMDRDQTMAETVRPFAPSATEIAVYAEEYERTGFQGGLNWYRASLEPHLVADLTLFSSKAINVYRRPKRLGRIPDAPVGHGFARRSPCSARG